MAVYNRAAQSIPILKRYFAVSVLQVLRTFGSVRYVRARPSTAPPPLYIHTQGVEGWRDGGGGGVEGWRGGGVEVRENGGGGSCDILRYGPVRFGQYVR